MWRLRRPGALLLALLAVACDREQPAAAPEPPPEPVPLLLSLSPEVSRLIVELGVGREVVGADTASLALPELAEAVDLGPNAERGAELASALRAQRAIGLGDARGRALALRLEAQGVPTTLLAPRSANEVVEAVHRLGNVLRRETRATAVAARIARDVSRVATRRDGRARLVAAWLLERDPPVVVGGGGLLHELLELSGAENAFHGPLEERLATTPEALAALKLDVLLDASGAAPDAAPLGPEGVRLQPVPPELATLPALDLVERVTRLHALLYPEDAEARMAQGASDASGESGRLTEAATGR